MNGNINAGWESYYSSSTSDTSWKKETEPFLLENMPLLIKDKGKICVLDVGCGDGRNTFIWVKGGHNVCSLDIALSGLKKIPQKIKNLGLDSPILLCENFLETNLIEENFDIVQSFDTLEHIENPKVAIEKLCNMAKSGGYIIFNYLTKNDCSYGEGQKIDDNTFIYKDTLFKFMSEEDIVNLLPISIDIVTKKTKRWEDPPHGDFRPYMHIHEAAFFLLKKK